MAAETVHGCLLCGHTYDPEAGDPEHGIPPGTPFDQLPPGWTCPSCGADRADFLEVPRPG